MPLRIQPLAIPLFALPSFPPPTLEGPPSEVLPASNHAARARDGGRFAPSSAGYACEKRETSNRSQPSLPMQQHAQAWPLNGRTDGDGDARRSRDHDVNKGRTDPSGHETFGFMAPCWRLLERAQTYMDQARVGITPRMTSRSAQSHVAMLSHVSSVSLPYSLISLVLSLHISLAKVHSYGATDSKMFLRRALQ